jgi:hypothetical protein
LKSSRNQGGEIDNQDKLWEVTESMVNSYEEDIEWTRSHMVQLFEDLCTVPKYRTLTEEEGKYRLDVSEKGTVYSKDFPCFKTEYIFEDKFLLCEVANCLHDLL